MGRGKRNRSYRHASANGARPVWELLGGYKKKFQPWCDLIAHYGLGILDIEGAPKRDYEFIIALYFHIERTELRRGLTYIRSVGALLNTQPLGPEWFEAWFDNPEEAAAHKTRHDSLMNDAIKKSTREANDEFYSMIGV